MENLYRNCIVIKKNLSVVDVSFVGIEILYEILKTIQKIGFEREIQKKWRITRLPHGLLDEGEFGEN